jgi:hypothetical protein
MYPGRVEVTLPGSYIGNLPRCSDQTNMGNKRRQAAVVE